MPPRPEASELVQPDGPGRAGLFPGAAGQGLQEASGGPPAHAGGEQFRSRPRLFGPAPDLALRPRRRWRRNGTLKRRRKPVCFCGHTHQPCVWQHTSAKAFLPGVGTIKLNGTDRFLVNVGSVGLPRDEDHRACYVIYEPKLRQVKFRRVPTMSPRRRARSSRRACPPNSRPSSPWIRSVDPGDATRLLPDTLRLVIVKP
jgi:diadenosine tetraphosphatase ApaH/serine/threonine PP2A family protein phosphatase